MVQRKTLENSIAFHKSLNRELSHDSVILLLDMYLKIKTDVHIKTCKQMLITFITAKK